MPQRMRGATELLNRLTAALDTIVSEARDGHDQARRDPIYARDRFDAIVRLVDEVRGIIELELAPKLERQSPEYEKRLAAVEEKIEALTAGRIVPFRREA